MDKPDQEKTLFEDNPDLLIKLKQLREQARQLGLMGTVDFS